MAPADKQKQEAQGPPPAPPLLECALSKGVNIVPLLPWTTSESNEHERTPIWPSAIEKRLASKAVYPLFLHIVYVGLVPPFSRFFTSILNDHGIQDLHLQPKSVLLLSVFAFYYKAFSGNLVLKAGKKVENFRHRWVFMSFKDANPRLEEPKGLPKKTSVWSSTKLSDPRAVPVLERFSRDISTKRLTGGMIVKEFLA
ncbi:hypothetical protein D1007_36272 [Hordeum vulgare]|nr:hypothetical protein D1007_36272 [Hordeum vulgare]